MTRKTAAEVRAFKERMSDMFKNVTIGEFLELIALIKEHEEQVVECTACCYCTKHAAAKHATAGATQGSDPTLGISSLNIRVQPNTAGPSSPSPSKHNVGFSSVGRSSDKEPWFPHASFASFMHKRYPDDSSDDEGPITFTNKNNGKDKFITVTVGKKIGVFPNWKVASPYVQNVSGATFQGYHTFEEAMAAFNETPAKLRRIVD